MTLSEGIRQPEVLEVDPDNLDEAGSVDEEHPDEIKQADAIYWVFSEPISYLLLLPQKKCIGLSSEIVNRIWPLSDWLRQWSLNRPNYRNALNEQIPELDI